MYSDAACAGRILSGKPSGYRTMSENGGTVQFFRRAGFQNIGTITEENLTERLKREEQALCIVNTKKRAQALYQKMKEEGEGVYHLSTTMYPKHRRRVLEQIRERLRNREEMYCYIYQFGRGRCRFGFLCGVSAACRSGFHDSGGREM